MAKSPSSLRCWAFAAWWTFLAVAPTIAAGPESPVTSDKAIEALLEPIREKHQVPGLVAGIVKSQGLTAAGATGVRKAGSPELITVNDKLHLGSDTKAMTATQIAMLVEESKLSWQSTIGEVFASFKTDLHADFHAVTLEQLLTHRAGLPANGPFFEFNQGPIVGRREAFLKKMLGQPPLHPPGTKFLYSNVGYIVAGHFAEQVTGKSWEELMTAGLFGPLEMGSAGFGPPGTKDLVDQPWGHKLVFGKIQPLQLDNAPLLGPAGTVHCSLADWGKFIALHLRGARGDGTMLKPETFKVLHSPPAGQEYAMGWIVVQRSWARGRALTHAGSNTMWFATAWIAPEREIAFLAVANQGGDAGARACDAAVAALIGREDKSAPQAKTEEKLAVEIQKTPKGVRFGVLGGKKAAPAPTLFVFANDVVGTLESTDYNKVGRLLADKGVLCVGLDLPCHGQEIRDNEPQGIAGWAARLREGKDPIGPFLKSGSAVLDHLVAEGYTDRERVMACGTSRGGFVALHFAAAEPRIRCVAAFAPVTDLLAVTEFAGLEKNDITNGLSLSRHADQLAARPIWMCIGNNDERVDTDRAIAFTREVVKASTAQKKPALVELHVMTSPGHTIHPTAHDEAAAWFAAQLK